VFLVFIDEHIVVVSRIMAGRDTTEYSCHVFAYTFFFIAIILFLVLVIK
jgi:hypothetical protein